MKTELLEEYRHVRAQMAELEKRKKELDIKIIEDMQKDQVREYACDFGKLFLKPSPTYVYSHNVLTMEKEIKELKKQEVETGIATVKTNKLSLNFRES